MGCVQPTVDVEHGEKQRICAITPVTKTEELASEREKFLM